MDNCKKRERSVNFTREETDRLVSLVQAYKNIIENKKSDYMTLQEKEKAWKAIENQFNSCGGDTLRNAKNLKLKYDGLKKSTRRKFSIHAKNFKTGGDPNEAPFLTPVEQKVKEMISLSVEGGENTFDSDVLDSSDNALEVSNKDPKKRCQMEEDDARSSTSKETDQDQSDIPQKKWSSNEWKLASLNSKKHPALCKPNNKRAFDRLAEAKLELVSMQKQLIKEELEEKLLKKQMLKNEIRQKQEMHELQQKEQLLNIEILKIELENKKKLL